MDKLKCPYCGESGCFDIDLKAYVPCSIDENGNIAFEDYTEDRDEQIRESMIDCCNDEKMDAYCNNCGNLSRVVEFRSSKVSPFFIKGLKKLGE